MTGFCLTTGRVTHYARGVVAALLVGAAASNEAVSQTPTPTLLRKLATPAMVHWRDAPARPAIERFAAETSTPLWIDRRVDARKELSLSVSERSVAGLLDEVVASLDLGATALDGVVYIGPAQSAACLQELASRWRRSAPSALRRRAPLEWPRLTEPRQLIEQVASAAGYSIENPEAIPHDLWPAHATPPLDAGDKLTLLCLGFDLQWEIADRRGRVLRLEPLANRDAEQPASLASLIDAKSFRPGETRYTLRIAELPIGPVLEQIAALLGRELEIEGDVGDLDRRVSFEVRQATLEELLEAAGDAAGLEVVAGDSALKVRPRK